MDHMCNVKGVTGADELIWLIKHIPLFLFIVLGFPSPHNRQTAGSSDKRPAPSL